MAFYGAITLWLVYIQGESDGTGKLLRWGGMVAQQKSTY